MPCRSDERECNAPPDPAFSTPTKVTRNAGAGHAESDAERMDAESAADVEKQFAKSTGRGKAKTKPRKSIEKRKYAPFSEYREVGRWDTGPESILEPREIDREIYMLMKQYITASIWPKPKRSKEIAKGLFLVHLKQFISPGYLNGILKNMD